MWIFTTTGFVSAVQDWNDPTALIVRARDRESLAPLAESAGVSVAASPTADYPYRIRVDKDAFAQWTHVQASTIDYANFKSEVEAIRGQEYAHALLKVWSAMHAVEDSAARVRENF